MTLYRHLVSKGWEVKVLFLAPLYAEDEQIIRRVIPDLRLVIPGTVHHAKTGGYSIPGVLKRHIPASIKGHLKNLGSLLSQRILALRHRSGSRFSEQDHRSWKLRASEPKLSDFFSQSNVAAFRKLLVDDPPDCVLVEYIRLAYIVRAARQSIPSTTITLIDTHDVMHERQARFHSMGQAHDIDVSAVEEVACLREFDVVIAIQKLDAEKFRTLAPDRRIIVTGHAQQLRRLAPVASDAIRIGFVGSNMAPNQAAVQDFLESIWPRICERFRPGAEFHVYGGVCDLFERTPLPDGATLHGFAPRVQDIYASLDIVINPVRYGGGLNIKNVEALCFAKPLITTAVGAEGLEDGANEAFVVCEHHEDFIAELARLIGHAERRQQLADAAYRFAARHFTEAAVYRELDTLLEAHVTGRLKSEHRLANTDARG